MALVYIATLVFSVFIKVILWMIRFFFTNIILCDGIFLWLVSSGMIIYFFKIENQIVLLLGLIPVLICYFLQQTKIGFWILSFAFSLSWGLLAAHASSQSTTPAPVSTVIAISLICFLTHVYARYKNRDMSIRAQEAPSFQTDTPVNKVPSPEKTSYSVDQALYCSLVDEVFRLKEKTEKLLSDSQKLHNIDINQLNPIILNHNDTWLYHYNNMQTILGKLSYDNTYDEINQYLNLLKEEFRNVETVNSRFTTIIDEMLSSRERSKTNENSDNSDMFFAGCTDRVSLEKRYRSLMKTFHPDTGNGDLETTKKIQEAYQQLKGKLT